MYFIYIFMHFIEYTYFIMFYIVFICIFGKRNTNNLNIETMTKIISSFTGTTNLLTNIIAVLFVGLIAFCLVAFLVNLDLTVLNRAF